MGKYIGESVLRKEDPRLVTGEAKYLEDIQLPGMVHAAVKRSDYAHAKIKKIDTSEAEKMPGVLGVWTCLLYTSPSPRDRTRSRMPSSA